MIMIDVVASISKNERIVLPTSNPYLEPWDDIPGPSWDGDHL